MLLDNFNIRNKCFFSHKARNIEYHSRADRGENLYTSIDKLTGLDSVSFVYELSFLTFRWREEIE